MFSCASCGVICYCSVCLPVCAFACLISCLTLLMFVVGAELIANVILMFAASNFAIVMIQSVMWWLVVFVAI